MPVGTIKSIKPGKGFGFIRRSDGPDIFFHCRQCQFGDLPFDEMLVEMLVEFEAATDPISGKPRAEHVRKL
ncbi:MAG: cold shock domain-containing protein [Planctomycetaceae bacterium]|nr:cold shock domain-containing protein [Planctomycetaceae bacterium]